MVLPAKDHAAEFIAQAFGFLAICGVAEAPSELEKLLLLVPFSRPLPSVSFFQECPPKVIRFPKSLEF